MKKTIKMKKNMTGQAGFTLIEVMVAMAILSIGILASVTMQYAVVRGNSNGNVVTQEMFLAQRIMEQMKNGANPAVLSGSTLAGVNEVGAVSGPYTAVISVLNPIGGNGSRLITVAVSKTGGFAGHPVTLRSLTLGSGI
jgi:prepilin-type N-terminal cleavage/methylation domain-containing protein